MKLNKILALSAIFACGLTLDEIKIAVEKIKKVYNEYRLAEIIHSAHNIWIDSDEELEKIIDASTLLPLSAYSAFFINKSGVFENIMDSELPMFSGIDLDQVSDWVDEHIYQINKVIYKD